ncbi:MAG: pantoate--beta-alanine ligase [bacterium]|nr:pantoate--beta-alanine ligase [bacterium]
MTPVRTVAALRRQLDEWRVAGDTVALVPTMGALHDGHMALVRVARERACRVVASLFVNPAQFAPGEDFACYPRDEAGDVARFLEAGVDLVYAPGTQDMYPQGFATTVTPGGAAQGLEADYREGFFSGVATVVLKLFMQTGADVAVFGEKDFQQLVVVRQMVRDLDLRIDIVSVATVREADGLAMSSRNAYLGAEDRRRAAGLFRILTETRDVLDRGEPAAAAIADASRSLRAAFDAVDYLSLRDSVTLGVVETQTRAARLLSAVRLGGTRLIDNVAVTLPGGT